MKTFNFNRLNDIKLDNELIALIAQIHEYKGMQSIHIKQIPEILNHLVEVAKIQSIENSNKIEGIVTTSSRIKQLVESNTTPTNNNEEEITGYIDAFNTVQDGFEAISVSSQSILQIHKILYSHSPKSIGGKFKSVQNYIAETFQNGHEEVLFTPLSPLETPNAITNLCEGFNKAVDEGKIEPLLLIPTFISDFVCIHPFSDGNGRMSRLLTTLLLYRLGYFVGKYISLEAIIEKNKDLYYEALKQTDDGWMNNNNNPIPFIKYLLRTILYAYKEFESRIEICEGSSSSYDIVKKSIDSILGKFTKVMIQEKCPSLAKSTVELSIKKLVDEGYIVKKGQGKSTFYYKK